MKALAALTVIAAILLSGCTNSTGRPPQAGQGTSQKAGGDVAVATRKKVPEKLDCAGTVTPDVVGKVARTTVTAKPGAATVGCEFTVQSADGGQGGEVVVTLTYSTLDGKKDGDVDGNTAYLNAISSTLCRVHVAVTTTRFLQVHAHLKDGADVCVRGKAIAKAVLDTLPGA